MAHVEQDSELFTNLVAAVPIPAGKAFTAFKDVGGHPGVFSLGDDGVLNLFVQTAGKMVNYDFGMICKIQGTVTAFAVRQRADDSLFVVFAISLAGKNEVVVLPNIPVKSVLMPPLTSIITSSLSLPETHGIFISDYANDHFVGSNYPDVILTFKPLDKVGDDEDCGLLQFTQSGPDTVNVNLSSNWSLPLDVDRVLDLAFGKSALGMGVFVLYQIQNQTKLVYSTYDGSDFNNSPQCPSDATCLASYVNGATTGPLVGLSDLLIGSRKIDHLTAPEYSSRTKPGTSIPGPLLIPGLKDLHVAQHSDALTMWFTNSEDAAGYYHVASGTPIANGDMVSLLTKGSGGRLSGMIAATSGKDDIELVNTLVSVDEESHLTFLQQSSKGGAWASYPMIMSTKESNFNVKSYTTRLRVMNSATAPAGRSSFLLTSTGRVSCIVNGKTTILESGGTEVKTDPHGEATFIVATTDVASHTFTLKSFTDVKGDRIEMDAVNVDPAGKGMKKIESLNSGQALSDAKTQTGQPLIVQEDVPAEDIDHAAEMFGKLSEHAKTLRAAGQTKAQSKGSVIEGVTAAEFWHWVSAQADKAESWVVEQVGKAVHWVVTLAGEVYRFVLDTIHAIGKAIAFVWNKLKVALQKLIEYIGFLLEWDDIIDAKTSFSATLTSGLDWSAGQIDSTIPQVDGFFKDIIDWIDGPKTTQDNVGIDSGPPVNADNNKSIGANWSKYQMTHGGAADSYTSDKGPKNPTPWEELYNDLIKPTLQDLEADVEKIAEYCTRLFTNSDGSVSTQQALTLVARDVANTFVDLIKNIVEGMMKLAADMLRWLADLGNSVINVPIFSALYFDLTGHELTAFDVICLVLAVPATITAKVITGAALPQIAGYMSPAMIQSYIDGTATAQQMSDINLVGAYGSVGAIGIASAIAVLGFLLDDATAGILDDLEHVPFDAIRGSPLLRPKTPQAAGPSPAKMMSAFDLINLVTGTCNLYLALPFKIKGVSVKVKWATWGMMAARLALQGLFYGISQWRTMNPGEKKGLGVFGVFTGTAQIGLQLDVAIEDGGSPDVIIRRIGIASCYFAGTVARACAVFSKEDIEIAPVAQDLYCLLAIGSAALQIWNIAEIKTLAPWEPTPTVM